MPNGQKATKVSSIAKNHSGIKIEAPSSQPKCVVQVSFVVSNSQALAKWFSDASKLWAIEK